MARKLIIVLLATGCRAQGPIAYQVLTNATASTTSATIKNNGQSQHNVYFQVVDNGGACSPDPALYPNSPLRIEASYDGSTYFAISIFPPLLTVISGTSYQGFLSGNGNYPFLRLNLYSGPGTLCKVNAWYSGTSAPYAYPQNITSNQAKYRTAYATISGTNWSNTAIVNMSNFGTSRFAVYGITLTNKSTVNSVTITLFSGTTSACTVSGSIWHDFVIPPNNGTVWPNIVLPANLVPYFTGELGYTLCGSSTGTAPSVTVSFQYRLE